MAELTDIRETVRERYARAAEAAANRDSAAAQALESDAECCGTSPTACGPADETGVFGAEPIRPDQPRGRPGSCSARVAGLWRADRRRRAARGRDRARPRVGRRRRRADLGPPRRAEWPRDRSRHDRRDARRSRAPTPPRPASTTSSSSRATSRMCRSPDESVDVVISNCVINLSGDKPQVLARGCPGAAARRAVRSLRRDRRPRHGRRYAGRHGRVDRLHRRRAHRGGVPQRARAPRASRTIEIRQTHRVHEHAASAIIRARKPAAAGLMPPVKPTSTQP